MRRQPRRDEGLRSEAPEEKQQRKVHKRSGKGPKKWEKVMRGDSQSLTPAVSFLILSSVLSSPWKAHEDAAPSSPTEQASGLLHNIYVKHKHAPILTHAR